MSNGGHVFFESPRHCSGWTIKELSSFIGRWNLFSVRVDGCSAGVVSKKGRPIKKSWRLVTSSETQATELAKFKCKHKRGSHDQAQGNETKGTERYPIALCLAMLAGLFMSAQYVPAMSVRPSRPSVAHHSATLATGFVPSPLMWSEIFAIKRKYKPKLYKKVLKKSPAAAVTLPCTRGGPKFMRRSELVVTKDLSHAEVAQCPEVQKAILVLKLKVCCLWVLGINPQSATSNKLLMVQR